MRYILVVVTLSGILFANEKLGVTFNFNRLGVIDFTKFSKPTMCRASEPWKIDSVEENKVWEVLCKNWNSSVKIEHKTC